MEGSLLLLEQKLLAVTNQVSLLCLVCCVVCNLLLVSTDGGLAAAAGTETPGSNQSSKFVVFGLLCGV
jgi:hypothetical protein